DLTPIVGPSGGIFVAFTKYHPCESTGDHLFRLAGTGEGPRLGTEILETDTGGYRVRAHKLTVRFDVQRKTAYLTDRVTIDHLKSTAGSSDLAAPILRINSIYTIDSVKSGGQPLPFRQAGGF